MVCGLDPMGLDVCPDLENSKTTQENELNQIVEMPRTNLVPSQGRMSVAEVTQNAIAVQEVMRAVMKKDVHYGVIPFTDKPTLYKAGAEVLCMTFRIADSYRVDDLSTDDMIRYRVTCVGKHQPTEIELGSGMGEGSTSEEKYKWRKAVCKEEFEATPAHMRRTKFAKGKQNSHYTVQQVRTEPADLANTVLKMACKRAKMAMVLNVTAASDCFTQDIEDLDSVLQEHLTGADETDSGGSSAPAVTMPQRKSAPTEVTKADTPTGNINAGQVKYLTQKFAALELSEEAIKATLERHGAAVLDTTITVEQFEAIKAEVLAAL